MRVLKRRIYQRLEGERVFVMSEFRIPLLLQNAKYFVSLF